MSMINGLSISDYRSIGEEQRIAPLGKINVFVGPNNCGKSNILRFIATNLHNLHLIAAGRANTSFASEPHILRNSPTNALLAISSSVEDFNSSLTNAGRKSRYTDLLYPLVFADDHIWIGKTWPDDETINKAKSWLTRENWRDIWATATRMGGGSFESHWIPQTLELLRNLVPAPSSVYEIPIHRHANANDVKEEKRPKTETQILSGDGAIKKLAAMQNPDHSRHDQRRNQFEKIQNFVRLITDDSTAELSVPHSQDKILVRLNKQPFLPLSDLGSGVEQVVLHAISTTFANDSVVTFEEPELHLHPVLQRQLLKYLATETTNQYFISTHSAHMIDELHANVFQVKLTDGQSVIEYANTDAARHQLCRELGYKPSDIVQSNCTIWVEGPSDKVYLQHWIKNKDPILQNRLHYSIMFYGGKLLSHLSADNTDDPVENLIQLRLMNRQIAVVIDSDKTKADQDIRTTKSRVVSEIRNNGGFAWVTQGREIENYVNPATLREAVEEVAPGRGAATGTGQFRRALPTIKKGSKSTVNKIQVAHAVASRECDFDRYDLDEQITSLCKFIREANDIRD